jgi:hypothetical protein
MKVRARWTSTDRDQDLYEFLTAYSGDPERDPIAFSASARFAEDLDGNRKVAGYYVYNSIDDTYRSAATAELYTAYVDLNQLVPGTRLRAGRQVLDEFAEAVPMDGGCLRFGGDRVRLGGFGGIPVNLFESPITGDAMYGGWVEIHPWTRGITRVEYLHLKDDNLFGRFQDDLIGVVAEQSVGPVAFHARYTLLEGESRDITGRLTGSFPEAGLILDATATYLFEQIQALSFPLDPYALFLMNLEPYVQWTVTASQALGPLFSLDASLSQRTFVRNGQDSTYNHEFTHAAISPRIAGWPLQGFSLAVSAEYWRSPGTDYWTAGADVSLRILPMITLGAGTSYALYSIDSLTGEEHDRVRSISVTLRWKLPPASLIDLRLSLEESPGATFHVLEVGVRHGF